MSLLHKKVLPWVVAGAWVLGGFFMSPAQVRAWPDGDFQSWASGSAGLKIGPAWNVRLTEEIRFGGDSSELYRVSSDLGATRSVTRYLDASIHYRLFFEKGNGKPPWRTQNRPYGYAVLKTAWGSLKLANRNQLEFRITEAFRDQWMYRNMTIVTMRLGGTGIEPYVADEVYFRLDEPEFDRNRVHLGVKAALGERLSSVVELILQHRAGVFWKVLNVKADFRF